MPLRSEHRLGRYNMPVSRMLSSGWVIIGLDAMPLRLHNMQAMKHRMCRLC